MGNQIFIAATDEVEISEVIKLKQSKHKGT
jgi:hypothetical protein